MSSIAENLFQEFPLLLPFATLLILIVGAWGFFFVSRFFLIRFGRALTRNYSNLWQQVFLDSRFLGQLSWILPNVIVMSGVSLIASLPSSVVILVERLSQVTILVLGLRALTILLGNINSAYMTLEVAKDRPIKGFIQVVLLLLHLAALILVISILFDKSPWVFLSGLGAMTAILLLIFRDTLLSLVAGFQLTTNNLVRVGDWIEMPQFNADGDVIDIALHTVRVQNWDKTITVIPAHKFLEHSFKNWRGMEDSGGRRIKRSVYIDVSTIRFLTEAEIDKLSRFVLLKDYFKEKLDELAKDNAIYAKNPELIVNQRRLTNIGTFRTYLTNYLRRHPQINQRMTLMVRQLAASAQGLPIEIYVFTADTRWAVYEGIQADIFDHILAIAPEFGLRVFQNPSGFDLRTLKLTEPI